MELRNFLSSSCTELFPHDVLERAAEKFSRVFHDDMIHKAVTVEKKQQKPTK